MNVLSQLEYKLHNCVTFSPVDYSFHCLYANFPDADKDEIDSIYYSVESDFESNKQQYEELAKSRKIESISYNTLDKLLEKYKEKFVKKKKTGCSLHHPFD